MKLTTLILGSAVMVIANLSFAQSVDSNTQPTQIPKGGEVAPSTGQQATLPNRATDGSGNAAAASNDPYVQKRQADSDARAEYKDEKKVANREYKAKKKSAKRDLKAEKQESTQMRNEQVDPASRKNSDVAPK